MSRGQNTSILHVTFQIPELRQPHTRDIDNVRRVCDRDFWIRSFETRDKRKDEVEEIVVECKQGEELRRSSQLLVGGKTIFVVLGVFLVF